MAKVVVFNNLTLDGVMQAPGRREEDQRGGFQHGGWAAPYGAMQSSEAGESMSSFGSLLLGRRTYVLRSGRRLFSDGGALAALRSSTPRRRRPEW